MHKIIEQASLVEQTLEKIKVCLPGLQPILLSVDSQSCDHGTGKAFIKLTVV